MDVAHTLFESYQLTVYALGGLAVLAFIQILVADVVGILAKHVPGTPTVHDHGNRHFRASRVVANTNESIAVFILLVLFCMFSAASPTYTAIGAWGFVVARGIYAGFYYLNVQVWRSVTFGVALLFLLVLLVTGFLL